MRKLLIVSDLYPTPENKVQGIFVKLQAKELAKHYRVRVLAFRIGRNCKVENLNEDGVEASVITYPATRRIFLSAFATLPVFALPVARRLASAWKPDLVHVHDFRHVPELFWIKTWLDTLPQPKYLTLHNIRTHPDRHPGNRLLFFYRGRLAKALSGWDHVFTVNRRLLAWVEPFARPGTVSVLGNAVTEPEPVAPAELEPFRKLVSPKGIRLVSVANLTNEKGFPELIEAVASLRGEGLDLQLVIVGGGEERKTLEAIVKARKLEGTVILAGAVENRVVRHLYCLFDIFVLPSTSETFGIVYLEAMHAGLPAIGTLGQGIHGLFEDGAEALYAKPRDSEDLKEKIRLLAENPELAKAMGNAGQRKVLDQYMMPDLIARVREVYERQ